MQWALCLASLLRGVDGIQALLRFGLHSSHHESQTPCSTRREEEENKRAAARMAKDAYH